MERGWATCACEDLPEVMGEERGGGQRPPVASSRQLETKSANSTCVHPWLSVKLRRVYNPLGKNPGKFCKQAQKALRVTSQTPLWLQRLRIMSNKRNENLSLVHRAAEKMSMLSQTRRNDDAGDATAASPEPRFPAFALLSLVECASHYSPLLLTQAHQ